MRKIITISLFLLIFYTSYANSFQKKDSVQVFLSQSIIKPDSIPEEITLFIFNFSQDTLLYIKENIIIQNNYSMNSIINPLGYFPTCLYLRKENSSISEMDGFFKNNYKSLPEMIIIYPSEEKKIIIKLPYEYKSILQNSDYWKVEILFRVAIKSKIDYLIFCFLDQKFKFYRERLLKGDEFIIDNSIENDTLDSKLEFSECEQFIFKKILSSFNIRLYN